MTQKLTINFFYIFAYVFIYLSGNVFFTHNALADASIQITSDTQPAIMLVKNGRLLLKANATEYPADNTLSSEAIYDDDLKTLYIIDHKNQTIFPMNEQNVSRLSSTINATVGAVQNQLESMSPKQQAQMKKVMQSMGLSVPEKTETPPLQLNATSTRVYQGIGCNESVVMEGDKELGRVCISDGNSTPLSNEDYQTVFNAQTFILKVAKETKDIAKQYGQTMPNFGDLILDGLIVNSEQTGQINANGSASFQIKKIELRAINGIELPVNYKTRSLLNP